MFVNNHKRLYFFDSLVMTHDDSFCLGQMQAEFQVMSPLVPIRQVKFLRYCKQYGDGLWAVVDISYSAVRFQNAARQRRTIKM